MKKLMVLFLTIASVSIVSLTGCQNAAGGTDPVIEPVNYTVTFKSNDTTVSMVSVTEGTSVSKPADPVYPGHSFTGWFNGSSLYDFDAKVNSDITLNAGWDTITYTITFDSNGGTAIASQTVAEGNSASEPDPKPTNGPHNFLGWYNGSSLYDFTSKVNSNINLTAKWTATVATKVKYNSSWTNSLGGKSSGYLILDLVNGTFENFKVKTSGNELYMSGKFSKSGNSINFTIESFPADTDEIGKVAQYTVNDEGTIWTWKADPYLYGFGMEGSTTSNVTVEYTLVEQ